MHSSLLTTGLMEQPVTNLIDNNQAKPTLIYN